MAGEGLTFRAAWVLWSVVGGELEEGGWIDGDCQSGAARGGGESGVGSVECGLGGRRRSQLWTLRRAQETTSQRPAGRVTQTMNCPVHPARGEHRPTSAAHACVLTAPEPALCTTAGCRCARGILMPPLTARALAALLLLHVSASAGTADAFNDSDHTRVVELTELNFDEHVPGSPPSPWLIDIMAPWSVCFPMFGSGRPPAMQCLLCAGAVHARQTAVGVEHTGRTHTRSARPGGCGLRSSCGACSTAPAHAGARPARTSSRCGRRWRTSCTQMASKSAGCEGIWGRGGMFCEARCTQ